MDRKFSNNGAFPDQNIGMLHKFLQVFCIFGLACYSCQSLMPNYWFLLLIFDTLSHQIFIILASNLP